VSYCIVTQDAIAQKHTLTYYIHATDILIEIVIFMLTV